MSKEQKFTMDRPENAGGKFLKLEVGKTRLRIVSPLLSGWEGWNRSMDSPKVYRQKAKFTSSEKTEYGFDQGKQSQFYVCIAWNYTEDQFMVWTFKQASIKNGLYNHVTDADWGDPSEYDIEITKSGAGLDTTYSFVAKPKKEFTSGNLQELSYDLAMIYEGEDPLDVNTTEDKEEVPF